MSRTPPPTPTEGLQRPFGPNTVHTYDRNKVGGLRTAVASALLLVCILLLHQEFNGPWPKNGPKMRVCVGDYGSVLCSQMFIDKDTVINAVTSSHDAHLLKLDNREDDMITRINHWMTSVMEEIHEREEIDRNRARVAEINNLIDHLRDEMDNLDLVGPNY